MSKELKWSRVEAGDSYTKKVEGGFHLTEAPSQGILLDTGDETFFIPMQLILSKWIHPDGVQSATWPSY